MIDHRPFLFIHTINMRIYYTIKKCSLIATYILEYYWNFYTTVRICILVIHDFNKTQTLIV